MTVYVANIILNTLVVFGLGVAIVSDWHNLRPAWRPVLCAGWVQEIVLLFGSYEAAKSGVPIELRQLLFGLTLIGLVASLTGALIATHHDRHPRERS